MRQDPADVGLGYKDYASIEATFQMAEAGQPEDLLGARSIRPST